MYIKSAGAECEGLFDIYHFSIYKFTACFTRDAKDAEGIDFCFPLRRTENKIPQPFGKMSILSGEQSMAVIICAKHCFFELNRPLNDSAQYEIHISAISAPLR